MLLAKTYLCPIQPRVHIRRANNHMCILEEPTTTCAYLPLFLGSWNIQEYLDSNLFWAGDGRFCGGFPPFCVFETRIQACHVFNCIRCTAFLETHLFSQSKSGNFGSRKVTRFSWNPPIPLSHFLSFFLWFRRPKPITGLSGW